MCFQWIEQTTDFLRSLKILFHNSDAGFGAATASGDQFTSGFVLDITPNDLWPILFNSKVSFSHVSDRSNVWYFVKRDF